MPQQQSTTIFFPNSSGLIVARLTVNYTNVNQFIEDPSHLLLFSPEERQILTGLFGNTIHDRNHQTNRIFLDALFARNIPETNMIPNDHLHHCVRCHQSFLVHNNSCTACVLPGGSTVRHTTSPADVSYGVHFARCNGHPDNCTILAAMTHHREHSQRGRRPRRYRVHTTLASNPNDQVPSNN